MTEMKLCKDCKFYKKNWFMHLFERSDRYDKCLNPIFNQNPVTGKTNGLYCDNTRKYHGCGMEGKYWEAK
jgi:hypothetical protein